MNLTVRLFTLFLLMFSVHLHAQHQNKMFVELDAAKRVLKVRQELVYYNQTKDTLKQFVLNDWNHGYSNKDTPLAKRFSDEYIRAFHLAKNEERGNTVIYSIIDQNNLSLSWSRQNGHQDIVDVQMKNPIYPNQKFKFTLTYEVKIPNDRFTKYGYNDKTGSYILKDWFLVPPRIENNHFVRYSNENLDDIANGVSDYEVTLSVPKDTKITTDLYEGDKTTYKESDIYYLVGKSRNSFNLVIEPTNSFKVYLNKYVEVTSNLKDTRVTELQKTALIDQITEFTAKNLGAYPYGKILVTQADYERNPMYGLNQLPAFLTPYPDSFIFEIRFLKTYLNNYLKNTLRLDPRKDNWLYDGIQMDLMMKYIEENHLDKKMMGQLSTWSLLKGHNLFNIDFNGQYNYIYLLTARKNVDQPIGDPKNTFIKFNEQIAGKYRSGLSFKYLDDYLGDSIVPKTIAEFYELNVKERQTDRTDFKKILNSNTKKDTDWFFTTLVDTRKLIDFKFGSIHTKNDSLKVTIKNRTETNVPVSLYGLNKGKVIFKEWLTNIKTDSTFTIQKQGVDRLALNYNNEIPEYNTRNNWKKLNSFFPNNRPIKFTFFQDIEDSQYNQIFYVPSFTFNIYDGFSPGLRLHNKSLLDKPFVFDVEPTYSVKTGELIGSFSLVFNQYIREQSLYSIRYFLTGSTFHYAPDARYIKLNPIILFRLREDDYRENKKQSIMVRQVLVNREKSAFVATTDKTENYSVFNARYSKFESEITRHYSFYTDMQLAGSFGKFSGEIQYRRLFNDNRRINLRLFAGTFVYRSTNSEYFSFGLDKPTDYMFDYNLYGRSEVTGLFSQQFIMSEGGFKSKLDTRYANQWMTTANASFNIWNWVEIYGDAGFFKNHYSKPKFVYDSGIRLNILPDYFELYFPVYSSNGFEPNEGKYAEKIRFVVTISPNTLISLFTRKWL